MVGGDGLVGGLLDALQILGREGRLAGISMGRGLGCSEVSSFLFAQTSTVTPSRVTLVRS
jgi:hypothetical protein